MKIFIRAIIGVSVLASYASAESKIVAKFPGNNQVATIVVPAQTAGTTQVVLYSILKGNNSSQIGVEVLGAKGLQASVDASQVNGSALSTLEKGNFWKIYLKSSNTNSRKSAISPAIQSSAAVVKRSSDSNCGSLPASVISAILANISQQLGRPVSYEEICPSGTEGSNQSSNEGIEIPDGNSITPVDQPQIEQTYGSATGFVEKDSCSKVKEYLVRVTLNLEKVAPEVLAQGFEIRARLQEVEYTGGKAASLKPVSDGMYAPRPLLLMQSLGGGQWVNMVKWIKGRPRIITKVPASPSIVFYRGLVLVRIVADKLIAAGGGKKVNYELTNGEIIYGICGSSQKKRWRTGGYPG